MLEGYTIGTEEGLKTGTMPNRSNTELQALAYLFWDNRLFLKVPRGYFDGAYDGSTWTSKGNVCSPPLYMIEPSLKPENIKSGVSIFGQTGTFTSDATMNAADLLTGKTGYVNGNKVTGTMANQGAKIITPSTVNQAIPAGYHNGQGYVKGDANLIASNIKNGVTIFGVTGTLKALTIGMVANAGNDSYSGAGTRFSGSNTHTVLGTSITDTLITLPLNTVMLELLDYQIYRAMYDDIELRMTELRTRFTIVGSGSITFFLEDSSGKKLVLHQISSSYVLTNYTHKFLSATVIQLSNGAVAIPFFVSPDNSISLGRAVFSDAGFNLSGASLKITLVNGSSSNYTYSKSYSIDCNYKTWHE